jgi:serine phosphatase RsbU (regulator of sigma subunit)
MRKLFLILIAFSTLVSYNSQTNLDSLWSVWNNNTQPDTNRLKAMDEIVLAYMYNQPDSAFYFSELQYEFAKSIANKKFIAMALSKLGSASMRQHNYKIALEYHNKSLLIAKEIGDKKLIAKNFGNIGQVYYSLDQFKEALFYNNKTLTIAKEINDKHISCVVLRHMGLLYYEKKEYDSSLIYLQNSLDLAEYLGDKMQIIYTLNDISRVYIQKTDYNNAIKLQKIIIRLAKEISNKNILSTAYTEIGMIQKLLGESGKKSAIEYFKKSLEIRKEIKWIEGIGWNLKDIGATFNDLGEYDSALFYLDKVIPIFESANNSKEIGYSLLMISKVYYQKKDFKRSLKYIKESEKVFFELNNQKGINEVNEFYANLLIIKGEYNKALKLLKPLEGYYNKTDALLSLMNIYKNLYVVYKRLGKDSKSLEYFENYQLFKDSIHIDDLNKQYIQWDFDKQHGLDSISFVKAKETQQLKHQTKMKAQEVEQAKKRTYLIIASCFLLLLAVTGYIAFRQKKKVNGIIRNQKELVEEKNKDIIDSMNYAKRIQSAILPPKSLIKELLPDSFILYLPKDIVAGDFYWLEKHGEAILFAVADCTGHGIPGAMVSVIGNNALNRSVREHKLTEPGKILDKAREILIKEFEKSEEEVKDGMDISLCALTKNKLSFAGANNPLWIVRNGELIETRGDNQPIGKFDKEKPFNTHHFDLIKGDTIYIFSDGFADQFGGEKEKKFMKLNFKKLLLSIEDKSLIEQKDIINKAFESWKANLEQIDDVCVMGVRV